MVQAVDQASLVVFIYWFVTIVIIKAYKSGGGTIQAPYIDVLPVIVIFFKG